MSAIARGLGHVLAENAKVQHARYSVGYYELPAANQCSTEARTAPPRYKWTRRLIIRRLRFARPSHCPLGHLMTIGQFRHPPMTIGLGLIHTIMVCLLP